MPSEITPSSLTGIAVFSGIPEPDLRVLLELAEEMQIGNGEQLFSEDQPADAFYVVLEGGVDVSSRGNGSEDRPLSHLGTGTAIGETSLLTDGLHSVTARATEPTRLLRFSDKRFQGLLDAGSLPAYRLVANLARVLAARLRAAGDHLIDVQGKQSAPVVQEDDLDRLRKIFFTDWRL
jgi:CRP-like cAMP-binding protein